MSYGDLTCKRGSVGQSEGLLIPRSSVRFRLKPDNSNSHGFELHRPSIKVMESGGSFICASCGGGFIQPITV